MKKLAIAAAIAATGFGAYQLTTPTQTELKKTVSLDAYVSKEGFVDASAVMLDIEPGAVISCSPATTYKFKSPFRITKPCGIEGAGGAWMTSTVFEFPKDSAGILFLKQDTARGGEGWIRGIRLNGKHSDNGPQSAHGIYAQARIDVSDCQTWQFAGCGIYLDGSEEKIANANCNRSSVTSTTCGRNGGDGFRTAGSNANVIVLTNCNAQNNEGNGFSDGSATGAILVGCHTNGNGFKDSRINWNCIRWYALKDVPAGTEPGKSPEYWDTLTVNKNGKCLQPIAGFPAWDKAKAYKPCRSYFSEKINARTTLIGCYSEGNEPNGWFAGAVMNINPFGVVLDKGLTIKAENSGALQVSTLIKSPKFLPL